MMFPFFTRLRRVCPLFFRDDRGVSAIEAAFLFPLMVLILLGSLDIGVALLINQKLITSVQTVADLLARQDTVSDDALDEAIAAGRLSLMPYQTASYGVDVAGIQFKGASAVATVVWRDTVNMSANNAILDDADGLGLRDEGVLGVTASYIYTPYFSSFFAGDFTMSEVSYARGRRGLFVTRTQG